MNNRDDGEILGLSGHQQQPLAELIAIEPAFAHVLAEFGPPPSWQRDQGFATLIRIILEQQVSLASAMAAFTRLVASCGEVTPACFLKFNDEQLKTIGFSRQKSSYGRHLARAVLSGALDLELLSALSDAEVRAALTAVKGVGVWTANIYLLMVMQRPDIWPRGDIALAVAYQELKGLPARPDNEGMEQLSAPWSPWRSIAARLLWHYYLSRRGKQP